MALVGLAIVLLLVLVAAFAPLLAPQSPIAQDLAPAPAAALGRALAGHRRARPRHLRAASSGARASRSASWPWSSVIVGPVGLLVGTVAGYAGGWLDTVLMRVTDVFLAFPRLILALAFVAALGPGHRERDHRHRDHRLAALRPPRPGRDADRPQQRLHRRRQDAGRLAAAHRPVPHRALVHLVADRPPHARHGRHHPDRRRPGLPRPRRPAAGAGMGGDDLDAAGSTCSTTGGSRPCPASPSSSSASASTCWATACATCSTRSSVDRHGSTSSARQCFGREGGAASACQPRGLLGHARAAA